MTLKESNNISESTVYNISECIITPEAIEFLYNYLGVIPCTKMEFCIMYTNLLCKIEIHPNMYHFAKEVFIRSDFIEWITVFLSNHTSEINSDQVEVYTKELQTSILTTLFHSEIIQKLNLWEVFADGYTTIYQNNTTHISLNKKNKIYLLHNNTLISMSWYGSDELWNTTYFIFAGDTETYIYDLIEKIFFSIPGELQWIIGEWESEAMLTFTDTDEICYSLNTWNIINKPKITDANNNSIQTFQEYYYTGWKEYIREIGLDFYSWKEFNGREETIQHKVYPYSKVRDIQNHTVIYEGMGIIKDVIATENDTYVLVKKEADSKVLLDIENTSMVNDSMEIFLHIYSVEQEDYIISLPHSMIYRKIISSSDLIILFHDTISNKEYIYSCKENGTVSDAKISRIETNDNEVIIHFIQREVEKSILHSKHGVTFDQKTSMNMTLFGGETLH